MSLALYYAHQPAEQVSLQGDYVSLTCGCGLQWTTRVETARENTRAYLDHWKAVNPVTVARGVLEDYYSTPSTDPKAWALAAVPVAHALEELLNILENEG